jgi:hypothetical protein
LGAYLQRKNHRARSRPHEGTSPRPGRGCSSIPRGPAAREFHATLRRSQSYRGTLKATTLCAHRRLRCDTQTKACGGSLRDNSRATAIAYRRAASTRSTSSSAPSPLTLPRSRSQCKKSPAETNGAEWSCKGGWVCPAEPYLETNSHAPSSRYPTHSRRAQKLKAGKRLRPSSPPP